MRKILVIGSGGREHALAWKLSQSSEVSQIFVAPGNIGMPESWMRWPLPSRENFGEMASRARNENIDLAVIGPDQLLAEGLSDALMAEGVLVFGPTAAAARIESSKSFAKDVMKAVGVSTAKSWVAASPEEARKILRSVPWEKGGGPKRGWVVKVDGLALGKGVRVCEGLDQGLEAVSSLTSLGSAGIFVIEERLFGQELSWMAFCDGERCALLQPARDYKRLLDRDQGPNTGGMGSFSPVPGIPDSWAGRVREQIFLPVLQEMNRRGCPFRGLLYAGLMVDLAADRIWVLEFNARFGDPETQVLMPRIEGDLYPWLVAVAQGDLSSFPEKVPFQSEAAVVVIAASGGYPDSPRVGKKIQISGAPQIFCAGVQLDPAVGNPPGWVTSGGRVLGALGTGLGLDHARREAYRNLSQIQFEEMQWRSDIAL
jgi:phosphoribosylamine--glycine ligase